MSVSVCVCSPLRSSAAFVGGRFRKGLPIDRWLKHRRGQPSAAPPESARVRSTSSAVAGRPSRRSGHGAAHRLDRPGAQGGEASANQESNAIAQRRKWRGSISGWLSRRTWPRLVNLAAFTRVEVFTLLGYRHSEFNDIRNPPIVFPCIQASILCLAALPLSASPSFHSLKFLCFPCMFSLHLRVVPSG